MSVESEKNPNFIVDYLKNHGKKIDFTFIQKYLGTGATIEVFIYRSLQGRIYGEISNNFPESSENEEKIAIKVEERIKEILGPETYDELQKKMNVYNNGIEGQDVSNCDFSALSQDQFEMLRFDEDTNFEGAKFKEGVNPEEILKRGNTQIQSQTNNGDMLHVAIIDTPIAESGDNQNLIVENFENIPTDNHGKSAYSIFSTVNPNCVVHFYGVGSEDEDRAKAVETIIDYNNRCTDENKKIKEFEEKPEHPRSNLASMGIYIFNWKVLRDSLIAMKDQSNCDFGKHIIPYCHENGKRLFAYEFNGYWKDVGTLSSYWEANMELIDLIPEFNLYEEYWKIYTKSDNVAPQYLAAESKVDTSIIGEGAEIYGEVQNSVIGAGVRIEKGAVVHNSIIMKECVIGENTVVEKSIIADKTIVGANCHLGVGEYAPSTLNEKVYASDLVTIGEDSVIPDGVSIGKNTAISGVTEPSDYPDGMLAGGGAIIKEGDRI